MFMAKVKETIANLRSAHRGLTATKRELADTLVAAKSELMEINSLPHSLQDQYDMLDGDLDRFKSELQQNIVNHLAQDSTVYSTLPCWKSPKSLETFLLKYGMLRGPGGREPYLPYALAAGSWSNLRKLVLAEIEKLDPTLFGSMDNGERAKRQEKCKLQIEELTTSLKELDSAD